MKDKEKSDAWGKWKRGTLSAESRKMILSVDPNGTLPKRIYINNVYEVWTYHVDTGVKEYPRVIWLSIKRLDKQAIHDWRELQRIKNELTSPECEAVEIYPAESRKVDTSNQFHLWVFPPTYKLPFGYDERLVLSPGSKGLFPGEEKAVQRPFSDTHEPPDF